MMKFTTWRTMILLTLGWAGMCYAADFKLHPRPIGDLFARTKDESAKIATPRVTLYMNHLCCSGCLSDVKKALAELPWAANAQIGDPVPSTDEANAKPDEKALEDSRNRLVINVADASAIDFVTLDRVLRDSGLVADKIELGGIEHFRLEASFKHMCCEHCAAAADQGMNVAKVLRASGQFGWVDSVTVNKIAKSLVAHARYSSVVDVEEFISALNRLGFQPSSIKVNTGAET